MTCCVYNHFFLVCNYYYGHCKKRSFFVMLSDVCSLKSTLTLLATSSSFIYHHFSGLPGCATPLMFIQPTVTVACCILWHWLCKELQYCRTGLWTFALLQTRFYPLRLITCCILYNSFVIAHPSFWSGRIDVKCFHSKHRLYKRVWSTCHVDPRRTHFIRRWKGSRIKCKGRQDIVPNWQRGSRPSKIVLLPQDNWEETWWFSQDSIWPPVGHFSMAHPDKAAHRPEFVREFKRSMGQATLQC